MIPKVLLKLIPVPKSVVRSAIAGEFVTNFGLTDTTLMKNIQQAVAEGLVKAIAVVGYNNRDEPKHIFRLDYKKLEEDTKLKLDISHGKSYLEALDTVLAGAVAHGVAAMRRQSLRPEFFIDWSDEAKQDPERLKKATERLNLSAQSKPVPKLVEDIPVPVSLPRPSVLPALSLGSSSTPTFGPASSRVASPTSSPLRSGPVVLPPSYEPRTVITVTPGKDTGITYTHQTTRRTS